MCDFASLRDALTTNVVGNETIKVTLSGGIWGRNLDRNNENADFRCGQGEISKRLEVPSDCARGPCKLVLFHRVVLDKCRFGWVCGIKKRYLQTKHPTVTSGLFTNCENQGVVGIYGVQVRRKTCDFQLTKNSRVDNIKIEYIKGIGSLKGDCIGNIIEKADSGESFAVFS